MMTVGGWHRGIGGCRVLAPDFIRGVIQAGDPTGFTGVVRAGDEYRLLAGDVLFAGDFAVFFAFVDDHRHSINRPVRSYPSGPPFDSQILHGGEFLHNVTLTASESFGSF